MKKIFLAICFWLLATQAHASPLSDLAASMSPGTWAELTTTNQSASFGWPGGNGFVMTYADAAVYDPITETIHFIGSDHGCNYPQTCCPSISPGSPTLWAYKHVRLTLSTNTWEIMPNPSWFSCYGAPPPELGDAHGYDKTAINPTGRKLYRNPYATQRVFQMDLDTNVWAESLPAAPNNGFGCCNAISFFPELGGLVSNEGSGAQMLFNGTSWSYLAGMNNNMASTWMIAEHSDVHNLMLLGGYGTFRNIWKVSSSGVATQLNDWPVVIYRGHGFTGVTTSDPVSGNYLFLTAPDPGISREFWIMNPTVTGGGWTLGPTPPAALTAQNSSIAATPIGKYGVTAFITCKNPGAVCGTYLYKHATSSPDSTPPAMPTGLVVK